MKKLTKRQRRQALIKAAELLAYPDYNNFAATHEIFSCNAIENCCKKQTRNSAKARGLAEEYRKYTGAYVLPKYSPDYQLARQLAVLMFMEATT